MKKIVIGKIIEINECYLIVLINDEKYKCLKKNISDYECNLEKMFKINKKYKFSLIKIENKTYISYKENRPKLLKNRTNPIPTISGFKNLSNKMHKYLKDYKL